MQIHPRTRIVNRAQTDLRTVIEGWLKAHDLTTTEELMLLTTVPNDIIAGALRAIAKLEREESGDASSTNT